MGCAVSKLGDSSLLSLCKERKELIMAATECRYALASSHILYRRALLDVADAFSQFVDEGMVNSVDPPPNSASKDCLEPECIDECLKSDSEDQSLSSLSADESPISVSNNKILGEDADLVFPLSDSDSDSDSELGSLSSHIDFDEMELLGLSPLVDQFQTVANPNVSNAKFSVQPPSTVYEHHPVYPMTVQWQESTRSDPKHPGFRNEPSCFIPMNVPFYGLMHPQDGNGASSSAPMNVPHYDLMHPHGRDGASFVAPMNFLREDFRPLLGADRPSLHVLSNSPSRGWRFPHYGNGMPLGVSMPMWYHVPHDNQVQNTPSAPVLMPPQPELTNWDYFNPFSSTRNISLNQYSQFVYKTESSSNIPDFTDVRWREGIPDLEDELEQNPVKKAPVNIQLEGHVKGGSGYERDAGIASAEELKSGLDATEGIEGKSNKVEGGSSDALESKTMEEGNDKKIEKSLQEVVKGIKSAFRSTFNYGKEVFMLLEADKLPYQYTGTKFKVVSSWLRHRIAPSSPTHLPSRQSIFRSFKIAHDNKNDMEMDVYMKSGNLSSTLDKLCAWEKKLYEEVKDIEKQRVVYDKECKKLKYLTRKGAEFSKIEVVSVSVERLLLRINVCVTSVDAISRRIDQLRDEELLPELSELIKGLIRMWTFMVECHKKQLQEIVEAKSHVQVGICEIRGDSGLKATMKLEMECMKWANCFGDWVNAQKSFVKFLNGWLTKSIMQEVEEESTPDDIAHFSPGTLIVCNDWYQAAEKVSESQVSAAINDFSSSLHQLWEKQNEERQQRVKVEYLSEDYKRRVRSFYEERGINYSHGVAGQDELEKILGGMKKRLDKQRLRHGQAVKQVNDAASSSLRSGMISIFEALESFCLDILKGYNQIRNPTQAK